MNAVAWLQPSTLRLWRFLADFEDRTGYAPTHREIAVGCYMGRSSVVLHLGKLAAAEVIALGPARSKRAIKVIERPPAVAGEAMPAPVAAVRRSKG